MIKAEEVIIDVYVSLSRRLMDLMPIQLQHILIKGMNTADELGVTDYLECSALNGDGVEKVFEQAARASIEQNKNSKKKHRKGLCNLS